MSSTLYLIITYTIRTAGFRSEPPNRDIVTNSRFADKEASVIAVTLSALYHLDDFALPWWSSTVPMSEYQEDLVFLFLNLKRGRNVALGSQGIEQVMFWYRSLGASGLCLRWEYSVPYVSHRIWSIHWSLDDVLIVQQKTASTADQCEKHGVWKSGRERDWFHLYPSGFVSSDVK